MISSTVRPTLQSTHQIIPGRQASPGWTLDTENDWQHDGKFVVAGGATMPADTPVDQLAPFTPNNGAEIKGDVMMVNGIMTDVALQTADLQTMANKGYSVVGIHNATKGMFYDLAQCLGDKLALSLANNSAVFTASRVIQESLAQEKPINFVGHSQGALVISNALEAVTDTLSSQGLSQEDTEQALSSVSVTSLGGAAATYPVGPTYTHVYNDCDMVPMLAGRPLAAKLVSNPRENFYRFSLVQEPKTLPPWSNGVSNRLARFVDATTHGPREVYLPNLPPEGVVA